MTQEPCHAGPHFARQLCAALASSTSLSLGLRIAVTFQNTPVQASSQFCTDGAGPGRRMPAGSRCAGPHACVDIILRRRHEPAQEQERPYRRSFQLASPLHDPGLRRRYASGGAPVPASHCESLEVSNLGSQLRCARLRTHRCSCAEPATHHTRNTATPPRGRHSTRKALHASLHTLALVALLLGLAAVVASKLLNVPAHAHMYTMHSYIGATTILLSLVQVRAPTACAVAALASAGVAVDASAAPARSLGWASATTGGALQPRRPCPRSTGRWALRSPWRA